MKVFTKLLLAGFVTFTVAYTLSNFSVASAEQIYCSTKDNTDYYVETNEVSGTASGLKYAGVYTTNGKHYTYCFQPYNGWEYKYWLGGRGSGSKETGWRKVEYSQLANDILYVTLKRINDMTKRHNSSNSANTTEVNTGKYIVYTKSIKLKQGIYQVSIRYSDGKGSPMFIQFTKLNGDWKFRDAVSEGAWSKVSNYKDMNDVLYVVLHSHEYE